MELLRKKNTATRITFPILDADGDTVTAAAALDSESTTWADGSNPGAFADLTNEATEIGASGIYYLELTAGEMNFDYIHVQVKTSTVGAKTQHILINTFANTTQQVGFNDITLLVQSMINFSQLRSGTLVVAGALTATLEGAASAIDDYYNECWLVITGSTGFGQARYIVDYTAAGRLITIDRAWKTTPDNSSTYSILPASRVKVASDGLDAVSAPADIASDADARSTFAKMVRALFNRFYNNVTQTSTQQKVHNDAGTLTNTMATADTAGVQSKAKSA